MFIHNMQEYLNLTQTLTPPNNEESEGFGFGLHFGTDNLVSI